jgi:hypothetical protein
LLLALIGKYGGDVKATEAAAALLPLPSREREMEWNTSRVISDQG